MKLKTWVITAVIGLFTATGVFAAPAQLADDMNTMGNDTGNGSTTMGAPNGSDNIANPNANDTNGMGSTEVTNDVPPPTTGVPGAATPNQSSNSNDDMSADTATGDDDY